MRLKGKVALIAGGAQGIGRQVAISIAKEGAAVLIADINQETGQQVVAEIKEFSQQTAFVKMDVTDWEDIKRAVQTAQERFGALNVLYNSIAVYNRAKLAETDLQVWNRTMAVNVTGSFLLCKAVIPMMIAGGGGSIILTSSSVGVQGTKANIFPYAVSKYAVTGITKAAACDYLTDDIRVNCICPGPTDTPMIRGGRSPQQLQEFVESLPLKRLADPQEIAQSVIFLASDESRFITGVALFVDGGQNAHV